MIHFVGAGPGAADLITVRGRGLLEKADVIIYAGSLVNPELLTYKREGCRVYNSAGMTLEDVISVMTEAHCEGLRVVRLHTGDPSLYGAIREQMDLLDSNNIEYELVPGVSSFLGAAAAAQVEFTLPGVSQTVILTRMEGRTPVPAKESISSLAAHGASMVVFLSAGMLESLSEKLIAGGYLPETHVAIIYKATWKDEIIVRTTVENMAKSAEERGIRKTALVFVGEFLGNSYERSCLYDPHFSHEYRKSQIS